MQSQFIYCENLTYPNRPERLIYHSKFPRFFARITDTSEGFGLEVDEMIDELPEGVDIAGKLKQAGKWYRNYLVYKSKHG